MSADIAPAKPQTVMWVSPEGKLMVGLAIVLDGGSTLSEAGDAMGPRESTDVLQQLTPSERRVALLVAQGFSNAEIAKLLHRSRRTVESQISSIFRRLGMNRRAQLVRQLI